MKQENYIFIGLLIIIGTGFFIYKNSQKNAIIEQKKIEQSTVVHEVKSPQGHAGSPTIENYKLDLAGEDVPPHIPEIHDCIYQVKNKCKEKLNLGLLKCINAEEESYNAIYPELDSNCKIYAEYRRICIEDQVKFCESISLKDTLRCMHKNREALKTRCQILLKQILIMYGVSPEQLNK